MIKGGARQFSGDLQGPDTQCVPRAVVTVCPRELSAASSTESKECALQSVPFSTLHFILSCSLDIPQPSAKQVHQQSQGQAKPTQAAPRSKLKEKTFPSLIQTGESSSFNFNWGNFPTFELENCFKAFGRLLFFSSKGFH